MPVKAYMPGLFDRLTEGSSLDRASIEDIKDAVARDLEALLNTRAVMPDETFRRFPESARSIATYGLHDFAGLSLSSADDRAFICRSLEHAIARHEPRLRNVQARLELRDDAVNSLNFTITALLVVSAAREAVNFDAVLQPSSLHYTISKARRTAAPGA